MVKNVLILGGDGFIGSHLTIHLNNNHYNVYVVDKADLRSTRNGILNPKYIYADLSINTFKTLTDIISQTKPDIILNCVAVATPHYYVKYPIDTFNLDFTVNYDIVKCILHHKIPYIQFSTSEVYGKKWIEPYSEDTTDLIIGPTHKSRWIYATSKILLEQLIVSHGGEYCIIRPQNFCGWDMDWIPCINTNIDNKWKPRLPACMLNNLFSNSPLQVVLPGTQKRCYTLIDDAINGIKGIIDNWDTCKSHIFNIGNKNNEIQIIDLVKLIQTKWNQLVSDNLKNTYNIEFIDGNEFYGEGYEDCERRYFDDSKIINMTDWKPQYNIEQTVEKIIKDALFNYKGIQI